MKAKYPQLPSRILKIVSRAVRNCPQAQFWKIYLISQEKNKTPMSQISQTFQKSIGTFMSEEEYKVLFDLYLDIRLRDFRKVLEGDDDQKKISSLQELRDVYQWAVQYLNHYNATHSIDIQGHWAKVEALYVRDAETSERLFEEVLKLQSKSSIYWEDAIESFIYLGKFDKVRNFLKRACNVVSATDFSFFARKWLGFERLYGSIESWEEALQRVKQKEEEYKETLQKLEEKSVSKKENKSQIQRISQKKGKRKLETDGDEEGRKFKKRKTEKRRAQETKIQPSISSSLIQNEDPLLKEGQTKLPSLNSRKYDPCVLHVSNLPEDTTEEGLRNLFSKFGKLTDVRLMYTNTSKFKGFAYLQFEKEEEAATIMQEAEKGPMKYVDTEIQVQYALSLRGGKKPTKFLPTEPADETLTLFVTNIAFRAQEEDIKGFFEEVAPVKEVRLVRDRDTNKSRGFAYVDFHNNQDKDKALAECHGKKFMNIKLNVQPSKPPPGVAPVKYVRVTVEPPNTGTKTNTTTTTTDSVATTTGMTATEMDLEKRELDGVVPSKTHRKLMPRSIRATPLGRGRGGGRGRGLGATDVDDKRNEKI
eukprot:TRINITY_DN7391_c0_g1_i14.p1 TRINITY_DN7391_c0_g1~~TRINITY_DN7391_c0_g1_i14.p1  ORF type:complete len:671 (+),score=209.98 TRINITY_DN7391_c0_g1_i14:245-2014(+)